MAVLAAVMERVHGHVADNVGQPLVAEVGVLERRKGRKRLVSWLGADHEIDPKFLLEELDQLRVGYPLVVSSQSVRVGGDVGDVHISLVLDRRSAGIIGFKVD